MTSNHTPGPWEVVDESSKYAEIIGESRYVGRVYKWHHPTVICPANNALAEEHAANARLIAAAPDLLAALKRIRDARDYFVREGVYPEKIHIQYHGCFDDWAADLADAAIERAAIARATGKGE